MRVITGTARGKQLITVSGDELVRPTSEKVKEAIFSSIQFDIEGRRVLDLFAGCGQLGIEALSRGAESAVFVDASDVSLRVVKNNIEATGFSDVARVVRSDYSLFLSRCGERFDIAFLDPPYHAKILEKALGDVCPLMSDYGIIICEQPSDVSLPQEIGGFAINRSYRYGKTAVTVYRKGGNP